MNHTLQDSRDLAEGVNALNQARTSRAEAAAKFIVYLVIGVLGGLALLHYATPCEGASLCMAAVIPTRPGLLYRAWRRVHMAVRAVHLRILLRAVEQDIEYHQQTAWLAPQLEALARQRRDELQVQLVDCELATRVR